MRGVRRSSASTGIEQLGVHGGGGTGRCSPDRPPPQAQAGCEDSESLVERGVAWTWCSGAQLVMEPSHGDRHTDNTAAHSYWTHRLHALTFSRHHGPCSQAASSRLSPIPSQRLASACLALLLWPEARWLSGFSLRPAPPWTQGQGGSLEVVGLSPGSWVNWAHAPFL